MGAVGSLTANADVQFASGTYMAIDFLQAERQDAYAIGNLDLTYTPDNGRWKVSAFVHNVWNELVVTAVNRSPFITAANPLADKEGLFTGSVRPPRTFGGRVRLSF
jgi:iron complex outermembrane receptor protein